MENNTKTIPNAPAATEDGEKMKTDKRFEVKHFPDGDFGKKWALLNSNNEVIGYAYCRTLADKIVSLMNADPSCADFTS